MNTNTIKQIREQRDLLATKVKNTTLSDFKDKTFGNESEYSYKGLMGGLKGMFVDITTLTKESRKFIKVSSYGERNNLQSYLQQMNTYFHQPHSTQFINSFESLKKLLRDLNVRSFSERQIEFENEIDNITRIKLKVDQELKEIQELKSSIKSEEEKIESHFENQKEKLEAIDESIAFLEKRKAALIGSAEKFTTILSELSETEESAKEHLSSISDALSSSQSSEKLIKQFTQTVERRDKKLEELEERTDANDQKLEEYENERKKVLNEAKDLIASAKKALNYKTAEGISAAFQEQYVEASKKDLTRFWLWTAAVSMTIAIGLGIWVAKSSTDELSYLIGRISLIPLVLIVAYFAGKQYVRQKNIAEDYAYKMVLSKAIVGFSEQIKKHGSQNDEEYVYYMKRALEEIHKDPLRSRNSRSRKTENNSFTEIIDAAERIVALSKTTNS